MPSQVHLPRFRLEPAGSIGRGRPAPARLSTLTQPENRILSPGKPACLLRFVDREFRELTILMSVLAPASSGRRWRCYRSWGRWLDYRSAKRRIARN
jgi:hypothetical protein